jgi:hypothetical protein
MTPKQARLYANAEDNLRDYLTNDLGLPWAKVEKGMRTEGLRLLMELRKQAGLGKVAAIVERTKELLSEGERVFVATWYKAEAEAIVAALGDKAVKIVGGMDDGPKAEAQRRFTTDCDDEAQVLVGNIIAAGTGLTLHGSGKCRTIIVGSLPWTPSDLAQVEDRLCRIGQTREVHSIVAIAAHPDGRDSIDGQVFGLLQAKSEATTMIHDGAKCDGLVDEQSIADALMEYYGG